MNILILGGHGFIGHNVARMLKDCYHQVATVDCHHQYGDYPWWEYYPVLDQRLDLIGKHQHFQGNVRDEAFMTMVFEEVSPDVVIDLATYPNAKMVQRNIVDATENMITATALALKLSTQYSVRRFVLASSSMVYGEFGNTPPNETAVCNPMTLYGSYKLQCEQMCKIFAANSGLEYTILRPSALYGTRDMIVRAISKMTVSAITQGKIVVNGADNRLDFSNVIDVARAFVWASTEAACANQIYNCTRGRGRRIIEAAEIIQQYIPAKIELQPHDSFYPNRDTLNSDKLQNDTGWRPSIDIENGIGEYIRWLQDQSYINRL